MIKKLMLVTAAMLAVAAVGASLAPANFFHNGVALKAGENPTITASGSTSFTSPNGSLVCTNIHAELQLTGGTTDGHILKQASTNPTECHATGALSFIGGGTNSLHKLELTGRPTLTRVGNALTITGISLHTAFASGFKVTLDSTTSPARDMVATPNAPLSKPSTLALAGTLEATGLNSAVSIDGDLSISSPTYGFE